MIEFNATMQPIKQNQRFEREGEGEGEGNKPRIPPNAMEMEIWDDKSSIQKTSDGNCIAYLKKKEIEVLVINSRYFK